MDGPSRAVRSGILISIHIVPIVGRTEKPQSARSDGPGTSHLRQVVLLRPWIRRTSNKLFRLVLLKQNRDLPYLIELFDAGKLIPVIDGPYRFSEVRKAFRRFAAAEHQGKIVVTMDL